MKAKRLSRTFFNRPTLQVARELLGKFLVRKIGRKIMCGMVTETEAYCGPNDLASHASRGRTLRTEVMFGPPGHAYVYMIYGMYHCLNVVTEREGYPSAVLIRGAILVPSDWRLVTSVQTIPKPQFTNHKQYLNSKFQIQNLAPSTYNLAPSLDGPGKVCRYFQIDRSLNKEDLITSKNLWFENREVKIRPSQIRYSPRIGVDYAGPYKNKPWRFSLVPKNGIDFSFFIWLTCCQEFL